MAAIKQGVYKRYTKEEKAQIMASLPPPAPRAPSVVRAPPRSNSSKRSKARKQVPAAPPVEASGAASEPTSNE